MSLLLKQESLQKGVTAMRRIRDNRKYAPVKVSDLIYRNLSTGLASLIPADIEQEIPDEWIYYIKQSASYDGITTDLMTAYIYEHFKGRVINDRYADEFIYWDENTDFTDYCDMVLDTVHNTLISNMEKYRKIYEAQNLKFHPEWNVDGEEITERELKQTGTDTRKKTGDDTNVKTGNETDTKTGKESTTKSGNETDAKTGKESTTKSGNETDEKTGTETVTTSKTTYDSSTFYDTDKEVTTPSNLKNTLTYNNVKDETEFTNRTDTHTYNNVKDETEFTDRTDTHTYNSVQDKMTYNNTDTDTKNLTDKEIIKNVRHGNIGVVSTVKLLQEYVELSELNILDIISTDVVNSFTYMTY